MRNLLILVISIIVPCFPQTILKGELHGIFPKNIYTVSGDIIVKKVDTLVFEAGSELKFQPLTGIKVYGIFIANGNRENCVLFSLEKNNADSSLKKWNGLVIADSSAGVRLSYSMFCDAEVAVDLVNMSHNVVFNNVVFHNISSVNMLGRGSQAGITDDVEYIYDGTGEKIISTLDKVHSISLSDVNYADLPLKRQSANLHIPVRWSLAIIALGGSGLWAGGNYYAKKYDRQYNLQNTIKGAEDFRRKRDNMAYIQNMGMAICGIASGCLSITFWF
jgi:hypothetical protein